MKHISVGLLHARTQPKGLLHENVLMTKSVES